MTANRLEFFGFLGLSLLVALFTTASRAETVNELGPASPSESTGNTSNLSTGRKKWALELSPQISVANPRTMELAGRYVVPYANVEGFPVLGIALATNLGTWDQFQFQAVGQVSVGTKLGKFDVAARDTGASRSDALRLMWIPMTAGLRTRYHMPAFTFVRPTLTVSSGSVFVSQSGSLPSIDENFWIPVAVIQPALTFYDGRSSDWFGGFSFGVSFYRSIGSPHRVGGTSFDLGIQIFL